MLSDAKLSIALAIYVAGMIVVFAVVAIAS